MLCKKCRTNPAKEGESWCQSCIQGYWSHNRQLTLAEREGKAASRRLDNIKERNELKRFLAEYKRTLSCIRCGESAPEALDFHHRDPKQKRFNVSQPFTYRRVTLALLKAEIAKCDVLCANCHRKSHHGQVELEDDLP